MRTIFKVPVTKFGGVLNFLKENLKFILLDAKDTLSEENVTAGHIDVVVCWVSGVNHESVDEPHGLGSLSSKLARHNDLATLSSRLHDETEITVASPSDGQATYELVLEGFGLSNGAQSTNGNLLGVELNRSLGDAEPLLDNGGQFTNSASFLAKNVLCPRGHADDLGPSWGDANLDSGVAIFGQPAGQELVELGFENAVSNELSLFFGDLYGHGDRTGKKQHSIYKKVVFCVCARMGR